MRRNTNCQPKLHYYPTQPAKSIAQSLGQHTKDGNGWWRCRCPICHKPGKKRGNLSLKDMPNGRLAINCWAGCAYKDVERALIDRGFLVARPRPTYVPTTDKPNTDPDDYDYRLQKVAFLKKIQAETIPLPGTPAEHYLTYQRHLPKLPVCDSLVYWPDGSALVGLAYLDNELVASQIVYLNHYGRENS